MYYYFRAIILVALLALQMLIFNMQAQIILSQIYEGTSYNKCIEISNIGNGEYDFSVNPATVALWSNKENTDGNPTSKYVLNTGSLLSGKSLVICHSSATMPDYATSTAITSSVCNFNGKGTGSTDADIVVLYTGDDKTNVIDFFNPLNYENSSWIRKEEVIRGADIFQETEWLQVSIIEVDEAHNSTSSYLGYHISLAASQPYVNITGQVNEFGVVQSGDTSSSERVELDAQNLKSDLEIVASTHFKVSTDNINFLSSLILNPVDGDLSTNIYIVFHPESAIDAKVDGTIRFINTDISKEISVSGTEGDPTTSSIFIVNEDFEDNVDFNAWSVISWQGNRLWSVKTFGDNSYMQMSGYESDATSDKNFETLLITPKIDFDIYDQEQLSFKSKNGYYTGTTLSVLISTDFTGDNMSQATWNKLSVTIDETNNASGYSEEFTSSGEVDLSGYNGVGYIAFKYTGNNTTLTSTYQVDDILVTGFNKSFSGTLDSNSKDDLLSFDYTKFGEESEEKVYTLSFSDVSGFISVSTDENIQLSVDGQNWSHQLSINAEGNESADVHVKYVPTKEYYFGKEFIIGHRVDGAEPYELKILPEDAGIPQDALSLNKDVTLDLVTWNLEWFGAPSKSNHASSFDAQLLNVSNAIIEFDADIYALQEVVVDELKGDFLTPLVNKLNELAGEKKYIGLLGPRFSYDFNSASADYPAQRICFIYNSKTVSNLNSFSMFDDVYKGYTTTSIDGYNGDATKFWASGRLPYLMEAIVTVDGESERIDFINIHAKCCYDSFDRRVADATYLYDVLVNDYANDNLVILGDYNNEYSDGTSGETWPYSLWYSNSNHDFLHVAGEGIDHVSISNELYFENYSLANNTQTGSVTISDHDPILVRLLLNSDKTEQSISFSQISEQEMGITIELEAAASSNLPVEYKLISGNAEIKENILTPVEAGLITVQAVQKGNDEYEPAFSDLVSFNVIKKQQVITFESIETKIITEEKVELIASTTSGLPVSFELVSGNAILNGNVLSLIEAGEITIKAIQRGNEIYATAPEVVQSFMVEDKDGVEEEFAKNIHIYPNPVSHMVVVELPDESPKVVEVTDISGVTLRQFKAFSHLQFDVSDLPNGLYLIKVQSGEITVAKKMQVIR